MSPKDSKIFFSQKIVYPKGLGNWVDLYKQPFRPSSPTVNTPKSYDGQNLKTLTAIHERHSKLFSGFTKKIDEKLTTDSKFSHSEFKHISEDTGNALLQQNQVIVEYKLRNLGAIFLAIPMETCSLWLSKVFGGSEKSRTTLSNLEKKVILRQLSFMPALLSQHWHHIFTPEDIKTIEHTDTSAQIETDKKAPVTSLFTGTFINNTETNVIHILYPNALIKSLTQFADQQAKVPQNNITLSPETCENLNVNVTATLGETKIILSDILNLQIGDVVVLDNEINEPVTLSTGDLRIQSQVGNKNNKISVQLLKIATKQDRPATSLFEDTNKTNTTEQEDSNNTLATPPSDHAVYEELDEEDALVPPTDLDTPELNDTELNTDNEVEDPDLADINDLDDDFADFDAEDTEDTAESTETIDPEENFLDLEEANIAESETPESQNDTINETVGDLSEEDDDDDDFSWDDLDDI